MGEQALFVKQLSLEAKRVFGGPGSREYELFRRKKNISLQNIDVGCALPAFSIFLEWPLRVGRPWGVLRNPRMVIRMGAYGFHKSIAARTASSFLQDFLPKRPAQREIF